MSDVVERRVISMTERLKAKAEESLALQARVDLMLHLSPTVSDFIDSLRDEGAEDLEIASLFRLAADHLEELNNPS